MKQNCLQCSAPFEITQEDLTFYEKVSPEFNGKKEPIPPPTLCPECRVQRRMAFRNERNLYHRKCDLTGKQIISIYSPDKSYKVYDQAAWWSDDGDPLSFGRLFDVSRPFFEQFGELMRDVPRRSLVYFQNENSDYTNVCSYNKDCYLLFSSDYREQNLPVPRRSPDQRHLDRFALRNPRKFFDRSCGKCKKAIRTTYSPDGPEIVYCERCYLETVS